MIRRLLVGALGAVLVLQMWGAPAQAKGPDAATITGPGIGTTKLTWRHPDQTSLQTLMEVTRFWDGAGVAAWQIDPPAGDLGPKFTLTYRVPHGESRIQQVLYPFAAQGPVVYMHPGQHMFGMDMAYGWLSTDDRLTQLVTRLGGTPQPVESSIEPAAHEASADGSTLPWRALALWLGVGGAALFGAALLARSRLRAGAQPH